MKNTFSRNYTTYHVIQTGELLTAKLFMQGHTVPCTLLAQVTCQHTAVATKIEAKHTLREREREHKHWQTTLLIFLGSLVPAHTIYLQN